MPGQDSVPAGLSERIGHDSDLAGALLLGSFATRTADELSDVDVLVVVREGRFEAAWAARSRLEGGEAVHERTAATADRPANEDHVEFSVADVDRACDELRADGTDVLVAPHDCPWGRSAYLRDPDGSMLELSQA